MSILHRYIFRSVVSTCLGAIGVLVFILVLGNAMRDLFKLFSQGQLSLATSGEMILLLIPFVLSYALPLGVLTGVLLTLGRLSADREVIAMRSAGIGLVRMSAPIIFVAVLGVAVSLVMNFHYAPNAKARYGEIIRDAVKKNPLSFIVERSFIREFPGYIIYVGSKQDNQLGDFWIWELDNRKRAVKFIRAQSGRFEYDEKDNYLILVLNQGQSEFRSTDSPEDFSEMRPILAFDRASIQLPLRQIFGRQEVKKRIGDMNLPELLAEFRRLGDPAENLTEAERKDRRMDIRLNIHEDLSLAYSVFSLTLIGIPLGIQVSRKETSANLGVAVVLAMGFYFMMNMAGLLDKFPQYRPDLMLWVPNILFQILGFTLCYRFGRA
ncbi:MAG: LptF/LptG family permease [Opitutaceae bacterium]